LTKENLIMKKLILILSLIFAVSACKTPVPKYIISSSAQKIDFNDGALPNAYIVLNQDLVAGSPIIANTIAMMDNNKLKPLKKYLDSIENSDKANQSMLFAKTLYLTKICDYENALLYASKVNAPEYLIYKELLLIDLNYEVESLKGVADIAKYIEKYQTLFDKNINNEILKNIIKSRVILLRYN
jgi:hypothetical protein